MLMTNCLLRKCPKKHQSTEIINYYCPLELPFIAHRLQTMKKGEDRKKKKDLFGYYQDYSIVCFLIVSVNVCYMYTYMYLYIS